MKLFKLFLLTTLIILIVFLSGCKTGGGEEVDNTLKNVIVIVNATDEISGVSLSGTVEVTTEYGVYSGSMGIFQQRYVKSHRIF